MRLSHQGKEGALCMGRDVVAHLAPHTDPAHATSAAGTGGAVLMRAQAELVLQPVALPENADPGCLHSCTILASDSSELARVVWFKPASADAMAGLSRNTTTSLVSRLRSWAGQQMSEAPSTAVQQASGVYISLGNGILPGRDREVATLQGEGTLLPFSRAPMARSTEIEPVIGELNSAAAECLLLAFPDMEEWCVSLDGTQDDCSERDDWVRVCQYPRVPREGARTLPSHQVVVRGHAMGENPCSSGADLHTDKMDGGFRFGGCILFCGDWEEGQTQWRDFAVLEGQKGGRGVAVRVLSGDWICALCCRYNSKLHGTIFEDVRTEDADADAVVALIEAVRVFVETVSDTASITLTGGPNDASSLARACLASDPTLKVRHFSRAEIDRTDDGIHPSVRRMQTQHRCGGAVWAAAETLEQRIRGKQGRLAYGLRKEALAANAMRYVLFRALRSEAHVSAAFGIDKPHLQKARRAVARLNIEEALLAPAEGGPRVARLLAPPRGARMVQDNHSPLCRLAAPALMHTRPSMVLHHRHAPPPAPPSRPVQGHVQGLHVVSYNLKLIESFVARVGTSTAAEQRVAVGKLDHRLRSIALREVWHARQVGHASP